MGLHGRGEALQITEEGPLQDHMGSQFLLLFPGMDEWLCPHP